MDSIKSNGLSNGDDQFCILQMAWLERLTIQ